MGLSPDEWRRALALSGASNETLDAFESFGARPDEPPQERIPLPLETQQALERTGSGYKLPSVEVGPIEMKTRAPDAFSRGNVPENPYGDGQAPEQPSRMQLPEQEILGDARPIDRGGVPSDPYPEQISDRPFDPNVGSKRLGQEYTQGQNQSLNAITEQGAIAQRGLGREAELAQGLGQQRQGEIDQLRGRADENRSQQHAFEQAAAARLDRISQLVDNPPDQSKGQVLRIIGAVIAGSPKFNGGRGGNGGAGIGQGLNMIGQSMAGDIKQWQDEIQANRGLHESLLAQSKNEQGDSEHEMRMTAGLTDLGFGVYDAALKQVRAETQSEEVARASDELRNGLRQKYGQAQMEINALRAKQGAAGSRNAEDTNILNALSSVPDADRPTLAMKLGPRAVELLGKSQKTASNVVGMGKELAEIDKLRNEGKEGPKLSDGDKKLQRLAEGVRPAYDSLSKYAEQIGQGKAEVPYVGIGPGATTMFAGEETQGLNGNIQQLANVLLRDESGANLPESEQKTKWDAWGITSPDAAVRNRGLGKMLAEYEGRVSHVAPVASPAAPAAQKPAASTGYSREELEAELRRRRAQAGR